MSNIENFMKLNFKSYADSIKEELRNSPDLKVTCCICEDGYVGTQIENIGEKDSFKAMLMFAGTLLPSGEPCIKDQCIERLA